MAPRADEPTYLWCVVRELAVVRSHVDALTRERAALLEMLKLEQEKSRRARRASRGPDGLPVSPGQIALLEATARFTWIAFPEDGQKRRPSGRGATPAEAIADFARAVGDPKADESTPGIAVRRLLEVTPHGEVLVGRKRDGVFVMSVEQLTDFVASVVGAGEGPGDAARDDEALQRQATDAATDYRQASAATASTAKAMAAAEIATLAAQMPRKRSRRHEQSATRSKRKGG